MAAAQRNILVTSALPYANGPLHLGHMVEYIQTDIWVRFQRMRGARCIYVCADDAHGTPIMLKAEQLGIGVEELIRRMAAEHQRDFADFQVGFDNYHSTHSPENRHYAELIYQRLVESGHMERRVITQAYDPERGMFLPDRFIKGECPRCGTADQYGDSCEACGATYSPTDLKNPRSAVSGATPVERESEHFFFRLQDFEPMLRKWVPSHTQSEMAHKLTEWFEAGLAPWDISRDAPYWGFGIPGEEGKYFYVWLDAPIGYMASFRNWCETHGVDFDSFWSVDSSTELYHFIGKDIAYFHTLFWPAMLHGAGFRKPTGVFCHGFLTVDGQKMSKSRGTFIMARTYLEHLRPDYLRYYFAAKLGSGVDDIDLNLSDFQQRVNSDLVGKLVNIASRCAGFVSRRLGGRLAAQLPYPGLYQEFLDAGEDIATAYEHREYSRAMREIMRLADRANQYIDARKPWAAIKEAGRETEVLEVCTQGLNLFRVLITWLHPVLPRLTADAAAFLGTDDFSWNSVRKPLLDHAINPFKPLLKRVERGQIDALLAASRQDLSAAGGKAAEQAAGQPAAEETVPQVDLDGFLKVELRVARILQATTVDGSDKLLKLELDLGQRRCTVFAGIRGAYEPQELAGRLTVVVANLKPRKMRFGTSEGMVLAAAEDDGRPHLLSPDSGALPGMRVR